MIKSLNLLEKGRNATIVKMESTGEIKRRLMDMGIAVGSNIECVNRSPYGDPAAFLVKGTVIALRNNDSQYISVI